MFIVGTTMTTVANDLTLSQLKETRLASDGVLKHVADVRLLIPNDFPSDQMYDLLIRQARDYLNIHQLDRGVIKIKNSVFTTVFDPEGVVEIQHANGHRTVPSPIMTVIHEYIKKTPGTMWGFTEERVIEVILRLSVCRTTLITKDQWKSDGNTLSGSQSEPQEAEEPKVKVDFVLGDTLVSSAIVDPIIARRLRN